jgi:c-di-GMP-binding flagellar brake protein YcgR
MIIKFIGSLFGGSGDADDNSRRAANTEIITSKTRIIAILIALKNSNTRLSLRCKDFQSKEMLTSMAVEVDEESGAFRLDEFMPRDANIFFSNADHGAPIPLTVEAHNQSGSMRFSSTVVGRIVRGKHSFYRLELPTSIRHLQKRTLNRVRIPPGVKCFAVFGTGNDRRAQVREITEKGLSYTIFCQPDRLPAVGAVYHAVSIELPSGTFKATIEVRNVANAKVGKPVTIGARFVDLDPRNKKCLRELAASFERETLRDGAESRPPR